MGNLYAITLMSVCWAVPGVGGELWPGTVPFPMECVWPWNAKQSCCHLAASNPWGANTRENKTQFLEWGQQTDLFLECTVRTEISSRVTHHMHTFQIPPKEAALLWPANHGCGVHVGKAVYTPYTPLLHFWWKRKCCLFLFQKRVNCLADLLENILLCSFCINLWSRKKPVLIKLQRIISESKHWH